MAENPGPQIIEALSNALEPLHGTRADFDGLLSAVIHYDLTRALQPLERTPTWESPEVPEEQTHDLPVGYFGASTGGAAALVAAAARADVVRAVVSRGGRPDLAGDALAYVQAPTLLIVGGADTPVIEMNQEALARLPCEKKLTIIPGATHLFEEAGALEQVAILARDWFQRHLSES